MTIRTRLTVWYAGLLLIGLAAIAGSAYYEMFVEHPPLTQALLKQGHTPLEEVGEIILFGGVPAFALALVAGWFLMGRALRPISELTRTVERVRAENLHHQIETAGNGDELDRLAEVFNEMTRRLDDSFQRIREFTLHASHELKTPLTVIRHELDSALREENLSAVARERYASLLEEIERLAQIVDGLNFITRVDAGLLSLEKTPVGFDDLVRDACDDAQVLAQGQKIEFTVTLCDKAVIAGDRRRLRQLLLILTDNAVKYNWVGGRIIATVREDGKRAILTLSNTGAGISKEVLGRVFDRFFRGNSSHNHEVEGCGLGLAIAQGIVRAHGGEIGIGSELNGLTTVTVSFPLVAESGAETETDPESQCAELGLESASA